MFGEDYHTKWVQVERRDSNWQRKKDYVPRRNPEGTMRTRKSWRAVFLPMKRFLRGFWRKNIRWFFRSRSFLSTINMWAQESARFQKLRPGDCRRYEILPGKTVKKFFGATASLAKMTTFFLFACQLRWFVSFIICTLPETNMAPENRYLEKEIPIGNHHLKVPC